MHSLVLGGSVFVGRHMVEMLVELGDDVTVLNRGKTPTQLPDGVRHLRADRTDAESMRTALDGTEWDAVYDVSGFVMVAGGSDIDLLLDLLDGNVGHYVYVSSIMAYDQSLLGVFPWVESMATNAEGASAYGGFKGMAETAMLDRYARGGFPVSIVRPAAIYGPHNNIFDMETPMFMRLRQGRPILVPHGGMVAASYGHIDDLCRAMTALVGNESASGEVFNVTAEAVTVNRYIEVLGDIVGAEPDVVFLPDDVRAAITTPVYGHLFGARHHAVLSIDKIDRLVGIRPEWDFRAGHEQTYEWFLEQGWGQLSGDEPLRDLVWRASWDFSAEADLARTLR